MTLELGTISSVFLLCHETPPYALSRTFKGVHQTRAGPYTGRSAAIFRESKSERLLSPEAVVQAPIKLLKSRAAFGRGCVKRAVFFANWHLLDKTLHFFVSLSEVVVAASKKFPLWPGNNSRLTCKLTRRWAQNGPLRPPVAVP